MRCVRQTQLAISKLSALFQVSPPTLCYTVLRLGHTSSQPAIKSPYLKYQTNPGEGI
jgi:hypothetical protein